MNKNLLTYLSHNFCVNCCGNMKKLDCDSRNTTCDKLANFLVGCNSYKDEINEKELDELAGESYPYFLSDDIDIWIEAYIAGYRKAKFELCG